MKIIDFHVHIEESKEPTANIFNKKMDRQEILNAMNQAGVEKSVLLNMALKPDIEEARTKNNWLSDICQSSGGTFYGFGSIHPDTGKEALDEMERFVSKLGLKGLKIHPNTQQFDCAHPFLIDIFKKASELDIPVLIDTYAPLDDQQPSKIIKLVMSSPGTKVCLAHVGLFRFPSFGVFGALKQQKACDMSNIFFDLSAVCNCFVNSPFQEQFRWVCESLGEEQLLFGTDFPIYKPSDVVEVVKSFGFKEDSLNKIFHENAKRLLKI